MAGKCADNKTFWSCFFPSLVQMRMCGAKQVHLFKVTELEAPQPGCYWSWWDAEEKRFNHTNSHKAGVEICFPAVMSFYEERGDGLLLPVAITIIEGPIQL
jgi:hypothetical protein